MEKRWKKLESDIRMRNKLNFKSDLTFKNKMGIPELGVGSSYLGPLIEKKKANIYPKCMEGPIPVRSSYFVSWKFQKTRVSIKNDGYSISM